MQPQANEKQNPNQFSNGAEAGIVKDSKTVATFGNQATGFSPGFGGQRNTVFGTFSNQSNQHQGTTSNSSAFGGTQNCFGNNYFPNAGYFPQQTFGFGRTMSTQTTSFCFTGFGEPKTNYCFTNSFSATIKKVTLVFENPDTTFGSSIFKKPDTMVEIEAFPINNPIWTSNINDFSFSVGQVERYNSNFVMKSCMPMKMCVTVKQNGLIFNNSSASPLNYWNKKISLTIQSDQPHINNFRPLETVVEVPVPNEDFKFSVGPTGASNSFEVQTSKNIVFKITFAEAGNYLHNQPLFGGNRQTRTGSVYFDQGRQMNSFSTNSGGFTFGQSASKFGTNVCGSSYPQNKDESTNGVNQLFGSSGQSTNNNFSNNCQAFGSGSGGVPVFGQLSELPKTKTDLVKNNSSKCTSEQSSFGSVNFDKARQMNPTGSSGLAFGQPTSLSNNNLSNNCPTSGSGNFASGEVLKSKTDLLQNVASKSASEKTSTGSSGFVFGHPVSLANTNLPNNGSGSDQVYIFGQLSGQPKPKTDLVENNSFEQTSISQNQNQVSPAFSTNQSGFTLTNEMITVSEGNTATTHYHPTIQTDNLGKTKTNCITAMNEYANTSLEELRLNDYLRNSCQPLAENMMTDNSAGNKFLDFNTTQNMLGNKNQAFFEQLHQLIPYLNAGSLCKCVRSCNGAKNNQNQSPSNSLEEGCSNNRKFRPSDNMTIDEFYADVFKYLEHIQKQYQNLESTLSNKSADESLNKSSAALKGDISSGEKTPLPVFGSSHSSVMKTSLNGSPSLINSETKTDIIAKSKKPLLFGAGTSDIIAPSDSKSQESAGNTEQKYQKPSFTSTTSGSCEDANKTKNTQTGQPSEIDPDSTKRFKESNKSSVENTENFPFECSTQNRSRDDTDSKNDTSTVEKVPNVAGFSEFGNATGTGKKVERKRGPVKLIIAPSFSASLMSAKVPSTRDTNSSATVSEKSKENCSSTSSNIFPAPVFIGGNPTSQTVPIQINDNKSSGSKTNETSSMFPFASTPPTNFSLEDTKASNTAEKKWNVHTPEKPKRNTSRLTFAEYLKLFNPNHDPTNKDEYKARIIDLRTKPEETLFKHSSNKVKGANSSNNSKTKNRSADKKNTSSQEPNEGKARATSPQAFKMKKISDELSNINDRVAKSKDSPNKSDTESDGSNFSFMSDLSLNEDTQQGKKEKGKKSSMRVVEMHQTGILMTKYGYYTSPKLDELISQINADGSIVVSNFTIGRKGYGSICFNKEINVAGLNIDELVHFRNKEIIIFPNTDAEKSDYTKFKNCDALVTLEQVWPHDELNHKPIKDPQHLEKIKYENILRLVCDINNIYFIDYRPETGSWLFKMKQFSKSTISCWDVEDSNLDMYCFDTLEETQKELKTIKKIKQSDKTEEQAPAAMESSA